MTNPADAQRAQARERYAEISRHVIAEHPDSRDFLWMVFQQFRHTHPPKGFGDNLVLMWRADVDALTTERDTLREALDTAHGRLFIALKEPR